MSGAAQLAGPARRRRTGGSAIVEYLGLVAAVAVLLGALSEVRRHTVGRAAPLRPVAVLQHLLATLEERRPPVTPRPAPPRRPAPRPRPHPPRTVVDVPRWLASP